MSKSMIFHHWEQLPPVSIQSEWSSLHCLKYLGNRHMKACSWWLCVFVCWCWERERRKYANKNQAEELVKCTTYSWTATCIYTELPVMQHNKYTVSPFLHVFHCFYCNSSFSNPLSWWTPGCESMELVPLSSWPRKMPCCGCMVANRLNVLSLLARQLA